MQHMQEPYGKTLFHTWPYLITDNQTSIENQNSFSFQDCLLFFFTPDINDCLLPQARLGLKPFVTISSEVEKLFFVVVWVLSS